MKDAPSSIKTIQRRLVWSLIKVFLLVTSLTILVLLVSTIYEISSNTGRNPFYKAPSATVLEAYYLANGSWEGVDRLIQQGAAPGSQLSMMDWERTILLNEDKLVVLYYGIPYPGVPTSFLSMPVETNEMPLTVNGRIIGFLVSDNQDMPHPTRLAIDVVNPILLISVICAAVTLIIGILLIRKLVNPLSEVIAAAQSVSSGNLKTRIKMGKTHDDLASLIEHFNHMTETLERNDNERRALLADIAHELRTPLSVLRGRLEGIVDGIYSPNEVNIAQALEETYLLERLVEDLRLLTLAESRQLHLEMKPTDLVELLDKTVGIFKPQAAAKSISISMQSGEPELIAKVDAQRIEQVIGNLIGNSLRYVNSGGSIFVKINKVDEKISIKVGDNGPGVPENELPFIFTRFWRGEKSRARVTGGAGLGLAISKQLIEAQGGQIMAANRPEGGLETTITLPLSEIKEG